MESREILYKAKRLDNKEWIEGNLIISDERYFIFPIFGVKSIDDVTNRCGNLMLQLYACEVDSSTLSQFTGLTDANENKIWENDIVLYDDEIYVIGWDNDDACFRLYYDGFSESFSNVRGSDCEVYGNMFDNRELLFSKIDLDELNLYKAAFDLLLKDDCKTAPGNWYGSLDELYEGRKAYYIDLAKKELNRGE